MTFRSTRTDLTTSSGETSLNTGHAFSGSYNKSSIVLTVVTNSTQTITGITYRVTGAWGTAGTDGGFTLQGTHTAQGKTIRVYDKVGGANEPSSATAYVVAFTPATGGAATDRVYVSFVDMSADDVSQPIYAVRALDFADAGSGGTTLTLPSVTSPGADDLWAVAWVDPDAMGGAIKAQSPLVTKSAAGLFEAGHQGWRSNTATGTRSFAMDSGTYDAAIGVLMIVGVYTPILPTGGWGVGMVRMGAN